MDNMVNKTRLKHKPCENLCIQAYSRLSGAIRHHFESEIGADFTDELRNKINFKIKYPFASLGKRSWLFY